MAQYILNMGGNSHYHVSTVDVFQVTDNGVTKIQNHGLTLSVARNGLTAASVGNYILAMGGYDGSTYSNVVDVFKVTTNGVEAVQNHGLILSVGRDELAAASAGSYILAMGGYNGSTRSSAVDVFKVTDNGVEAVPNHGLSLSAGRRTLTAASAGNYILAMGGAGNNGRLNTVDIFKVTDNGVEAVQNPGLSLSVARNDLTAASCGNYILAMGGYDGITYSNVVNVFKVTTSGVEAVQNHGLSLSVGRDELAAASCGSYILAMGGYASNGLSNTVDVFKVTDNGVEAVQNHGLSLSVARNWLTAASAGNYVLAMGGVLDNGISNAVDVFQCFE